MADKKISQLTSASTPLAGTEVLPVVQGGNTVKVTVSDLTAGRPVSAQSLTAANLTQNRILVAGASGAVSDLSSFTTDNATNLTYGADLATWVTLRAFKNDTAALASFSTYAFLTQNYFYNGGNKYIGNGYAQVVILDGVAGKIQFQIADNNAGGAGAAASPVTVGEFDFTNKNFTVNAGNVVIGTAGKGVEFSGGIVWKTGTGTPEGSVTAPVGSLFTRTDGGANTTLYVKESGAGNTGWVAK